MKLALVFSLIFAISSGVPYSDRIQGGEEVIAYDFPFLASITLNEAHVCGGFIYNDRWIVTTAYCVANKTVGQLKVKVGQISLITFETSEVSISVFGVITYPTYNPTNRVDDIALIQLSSPIVFNDNVTFIPFDEVTNTNGLTVVGWGATEPGGFESSRLHKATVSIDSANCSTISGYSSRTMIAASVGRGAESPGVSRSKNEEF